jgi:hypothetical protein
MAFKTSLKLICRMFCWFITTKPGVADPGERGVPSDFRGE